MTRFFIEEMEVDLSGATIAVTKQINDIGEVGRTKGNLSNEFKPKKTKRNQEILERSDNVQSTTSRPYRKNSCRVNQNGVDTIPNGYCIIDSSSDDEYRIVAYSGNVDLAERLGESTLADIDLSDLDHTFDAATVLGSFTNDYTDGYKYPVIDYGTMSIVARTVDIRDLRPATFVRYLFEKILTDAGYSFEGSLFSNTMFSKEILPCVKTDIPLTADQILSLALDVEEDVAGQDITIPLVYDASHVSSQGQNNQNPYPVNNIITDNGNNFNILLYKATINIGSRQRFRVQSEISAIALTTPPGTTFTTGSTAITFTVYKNGVSIGSSSQQGIPGTDNFFDFYTPFINCMVGDIIHVQAVVSSSYLFLNGSTVVTASGGSFQYHIEATELSNEVSENIGYGGAVTYVNTLTDMSQMDFVESVFRRYAVIMDIDQYRNVIILNTFNDIVNNIPIADDWSGKVDSVKQSLSYRIPGYAQRNLFKYKVDSNDEEITEGAGDGEILVDDLTLDKEATINEQPFSATMMEIALAGLDVARIKMIESGSARTITVEPRILIDDTQDVPGFGVNFVDGTASSTATNSNIPLCYFILSIKTLNLGFNNSLLDDNYTGIQRCLDRSKFMTLMVKLSERDFYSMNFFVPVFIRSLGNYFYKNKVINYKGSGSTAVELIRL